MLAPGVTLQMEQSNAQRTRVLAVTVMRTLAGQGALYFQDVSFRF